ncbi:serine hydrolase family protein [Patescibacteria group bacterium]|nr:serine hydrolase family protein [Patescibacteria group bacterium]
MKKALILHGTDGSSKENWFPWLKAELEKNGYQVWVPDLPHPEKPNIDRYNKHIFSLTSGQLDEETILIGHSSGAVAILGLLEALPDDVKVEAAYLVGSFKDDLGWEKLTELFARPFDFEKIKKKSKSFYFIHSDNDPYCPLDHARYLHTQLGGELIVLPGQQHFSIGTAGEVYRKFPYLLSILLPIKTNIDAKSISASSSTVTNQ